MKLLVEPQTGINRRGHQCYLRVYEHELCKLLEYNKEAPDKKKKTSLLDIYSTKDLARLQNYVPDIDITNLRSKDNVHAALNDWWEKVSNNKQAFLEFFKEGAQQLIEKKKNERISIGAGPSEPGA